MLIPVKSCQLFIYNLLRIKNKTFYWFFFVLNYDKLKKIYMFVSAVWIYDKLNNLWKFFQQQGPL